MALKTYRARTGDPVPDIAISKALRIGTEELGSLLKKGYRASCSKLNCCVSKPDHDDDYEERQRLIESPRPKTATTDDTTPSPDSRSVTSYKSSSSSSKGQKSPSTESTKTRTQRQDTHDDKNDDENEVPPEFQVVSSKTPETPPKWKLQKSKILVSGKIREAHQVIDANFEIECWPPSYPGVERNNFGARFYHSP